MGKERDGKEAFHWWDDQKLEKVQARKRIYVPLYAETVTKTEYFQVLGTHQAGGGTDALFDGL